MSGGHVRLADALLRSVGGRTVFLHIPAAAIPGDIGEQMGLATPLFQDVPLKPAVLRKVRPKIATAANEQPAQYELLVSASAVATVVGSLAFQSADVLFAQACGVVVNGELLEITSATAVEGFGSVYLYRLGLRGTAANLV